MGGRGAFSATATRASRIEERITQLDEQIARIDSLAGSAPRRVTTEEDFRWADVVTNSNRGELVTERKRLQRELASISGGRQMRWRI